LAFGLELDQTIQMKMEGIANINISPLASESLSASSLKTQGQLMLRQPNALVQTVRPRTVYDDNFFDTLQTQSMESFQTNYQTMRNETLVYKYRQNVNYGPATQSFVDVSMIIEIPKQSVLYVPKFW